MYVITHIPTHIYSDRQHKISTSYYLLREHRISAYSSHISSPKGDMVKAKGTCMYRKICTIGEELRYGDTQSFYRMTGIYTPLPSWRKRERPLFSNVKSPLCYWPVTILCILSQWEHLLWLIVSCSSSYVGQVENS